MASYNENQLLTVVKAYARSNPLPIDASSVWDDKTSADSYAKQANAYAGQIITAKVDNEYKAYILQGEAGNYTLSPLTVDASSIETKEYVIVGTRPGSGQQQGVIYIDNNVGYIWNGSEWKKVFEDVSASITDFEDRIGQLETDITTKANIANPNFTGTVKVEGKELATKEYADSIVAAAKSEAPIMIDDDHPFPSTSYKAGQKYVVAKAGEYFGQKCEIGDVILIVKNYAADGASNSDAIILQSNIDGAVTGPDSAADGEIVVFSGTTGKVIKSSKINMTSLNDAISKAHTHANKTQLDTYDKTQTELLDAAAQDAQSKVDTLSETLTTEIDKKANKATTLSGYGITDAYIKTEIDSKLQTINTNLNTKVDSATVDSKISEAKTEFLEEAAEAASTALEARIGGIDGETTIKQYIDTAIETGGTDSAEAIAQAKAEAIQAAKDYTDAALTIVEFS